jgi:hypothetical protein
VVLKTKESGCWYNSELGDERMTGDIDYTQGIDTGILYNSGSCGEESEAAFIMMT